MKIINLGNQDSILNHFIREIRDVNIHNDSMRFRRNIERIGELFAYEIKEDLDRLCERFYRVDSSRSIAKGGTGLGLSIVKHIIELHKQTFNIRSTLGEGSTFSFTLQKY